MSFDPDLAAAAGAGVFGLDSDPDEAFAVIIPVPFDATVSYRGGAARGPAAILTASRQVELFDLDVGKPWQVGVTMDPIPEKILELNREASSLAQPIIAAGGVSAELEANRARVDEVGGIVNDMVHARVAELLEADRLPCVVGGDHSVAYGAIRAAIGHSPGLGILQIDAHADLREAYEGLRWSHASVFHNVLELENVGRLVQVGLRDIAESELATIEDRERDISAWFDHDLARRLDLGENFHGMADAIVRELPQNVWLSLDIDGLSPDLCPNTGTPVPGGLSWFQVMTLLAAVVRNRRRVVGFDLCEVAPGDGAGDSWDAIVGARLLYKMIGFAVMSPR